VIAFVALLVLLAFVALEFIAARSQVHSTEIPGRSRSRSRREPGVTLRIARVDRKRRIQTATYFRNTFEDIPLPKAKEAFDRRRFQE
jgi:hypothetical protein